MDPTIVQVIPNGSNDERTSVRWWAKEESADGSGLGEEVGEEMSVRRRRREMTNRSGERMSIVQGEGEEKVRSIKDLVMNLETMGERGDGEEKWLWGAGESGE